MTFWVANILRQNNSQRHLYLVLRRGVLQYAPTVQLAVNGISSNFIKATKNQRMYLGKQEYLCC
jgi:hypothetical protein